MAILSAAPPNARNSAAGGGIATDKAVQLARRTTLEGCFRAPHVCDAEVIAQRRCASKRATPLTTAAGRIAPKALLVQALVTQRRVTLHALAPVDHAIAQRAQRPPDCPVLAALPGAGAVLAPRLRGACGAPRHRDTAADALQKSAGIAPVTDRSGNPPGVHWRLPCLTCLRQTCVAWAAASTPPSCWARTDDQHQRDQGASHQAAVRALACTWIRLLFRCGQHRTSDEEAVYLTALRRRGSPRLHNVARGS